MATYEQLATALKNAHAAGDVAAATKLATALKGMSAGTPSVGQPANIDFQGRFDPPATTAQTASGKGDMVRPVADNRTDLVDTPAPQGPSALRVRG